MKNAAKYLLRSLCMAVMICMAIGSASAQESAQISRQKQKIADLERKIAEEEADINKLRRGKSDEQERIRRFGKQINNRNRLIEETDEEVRMLQGEIRQIDSLANNISASLEQMKARYGEMVREAFRNYHHNTVLNYIFSSRSFTEVARKLTILREVGVARAELMHRIADQRKEVALQKERLAKRKTSLDKVQAKLQTEREKMQRDLRNARHSVQSLSRKEREALARKNDRQQELDNAIAQMRRLTKGNKEGASFSQKTTGLHLPVVGGVVKRYMGNMAEISGKRGSDVISIYNGKVVDVRQNRITNHYDVYIAHGEYISTYANLAAVKVGKGDKVSRNQPIGIIGSALNIATMEVSHKILFGIYAPNEKTKLNAKDCFRK